jgi:UDP-N-acetylmuramate--alanine ligase
MPTILQYQHFYFIGIKGVAMTALAQCLLDAGKSVRGSDVAEAFVTQPLLDKRGVVIDTSFTTELPAETECVVFTSAHQAQQNPQVQAAKQKNLPVLTHAEALADLFNQKQGLAVCGVGGKSTTSAMITWILSKLGQQPNFAIGVGNIPGLEKTGQWNESAPTFVAEADEYVTDPSAPSRGERITPRFSFLKPFVTVCTNLRHDHPDVYANFDETKEHFGLFFDQIQDGGFLIGNAADQSIYQSMSFWSEQKNRQRVWYGETAQNLAELPATSESQFLLSSSSYQAKDGQTSCQILLPHTQKIIDLKLQLPGKYNLLNAIAAIAACSCIGVDPQQAASTLADFRSTARRCEFVGEKHGVRYYDDYGHHPHEVASVIHAYREWFPERRLVIGFQSHTFSRTKQFFSEFIDAFAEASEVAMIDIFPSAREAFDATVTSDQLCVAISQKYPNIPAKNYKTLEELAKFCQTQLKPGDIFLTVGAGDIYQVHAMISAE